jgi:hypothetical protein
VRVGGARSSRRSVDHHWDEFRDSNAELFERPLAHCHENQPGQKPWRRGGVEGSVPHVGHSQQRKIVVDGKGLKKEKRQAKRSKPRWRTFSRQVAYLHTVPFRLFSTTIQNDWTGGPVKSNPVLGLQSLKTCVCVSCNQRV